jgi:hypothetical protein
VTGPPEARARYFKFDSASRTPAWLQGFFGLIKHLLVAVQLCQRQQALARRGRKVARQRGQFGRVLGGQRRMHLGQHRALTITPASKRAHDAASARSTAEPGDLARPQAVERQREDFQIGLAAAWP